jgi:hypothetical protein
MFLRALIYLIVSLLIAVPASAQDLKSKVIPLNGKLVQSDDPTQIGTNYRTLQNLRYTDSHVIGIGGMDNVNASVLSSYPYVRNAFHFNKVQPSESHVILHAFDATGTTAVLLENTGTIPTSGNFDEASPVYSLTSSNPGFFSIVPGDNVVFANGGETYIWGGTESRISAFITSSATVTYAVTNPSDYSDILSNSRQTVDQVATLSVNGGNDSYTKLLLHGDGANDDLVTTDSSASAHAVTMAGSAQIDTDKMKFGGSSIYYPSVGSSYISMADHADWYLASGLFTIDFWINFNSLPAAGQYMGIFNQYVDDNNRYGAYIYNDSGRYYFTFTTATTGSVTDIINLVEIFPVAGTWYHYSITRGWGGGANTWCFAVDGTSLSSPTNAVAIPDLAATFRVGYYRIAATLYYLDGWIDEFRVSKGVARWTANFTPPTQPYGNASNYFLVGSKRPLQGVKFYVSSGNTVASTMTVKEWQGNSWGTLSVTDTTDTGATLAVTGTINWTASGAAKARYINGLSLYWYQFYFNAGQASLYYVTVNAPMQSFSNTWDGEESLAIKFLKYNGATYLDYSIEVADDSQSTYADLSNLAAAHYILIGFTEPMQGIDFTFVAGSENSTATTAQTIKYWMGNDWSGTSALYDGTMTGTVSMSKGGVSAWQGVEPGQEYVTTISNEIPLYYYKISFANALDADVKVAEARGIPFPKNISTYTYPTMFQSRTILLNETSGRKNKLLYSASEQEDVFNGSDSGEIYVGDESKITAAATLSLVLTSALEQLLIFKENQTYRLFGNGPENWELQLISGTVGCVAPKTLKTVSLPLDSVSNYIGRHIAIFQGPDGIYVTDGRTPSPIHGDIKNLFDKRSSTSINTSMIDKSVGFIDNENLEYHWLFASGTSTTLDKEYVFDLRRWKWFEIVRGSGKNIQCGFRVTDSTGNNYNFGTIDSGYVERLEYGNDMDGGNIVHTLQLGDFALADNPLYETRAQYANLVMVAKTTTTNSVTYTHYVDTETTGTAFTMSPVSANKRIANVAYNINSKPGVFHSPKVAMTTNNEAVGFEPLYIGYFYKIEREHLH